MSGMQVEHPDEPEPADRRISWSVYVLVMAGFCLIGGALAPLEPFPVLSGGALFLLALVSGAAAALVINLVRPRYERAAGRWRTFYDFLLRQMSPPD